MKITSTIDLGPLGLLDSKWGNDFSRISCPAAFHRFLHLYFPFFLEKTSNRIEINNVQCCVYYFFS